MNTKFMIQTAAITMAALISVWACAETVSAEYEAVLEGKNTLLGQTKEDTAPLACALHAQILKTGSIRIDIKPEDLKLLMPGNGIVSLRAQPMSGTLQPESGLKLMQKDAGKDKE